MKGISLFVLLIVVLGLLGCAHTIGRVEQRWGPPASVEQQGDYTLYYYSFNKVSRRGSGVLNVTLTCDNAGNILSKSQIWEPSESVAPFPSPYAKKRARTVQPVREEVDASADPTDTKTEVATVQSLHGETDVSSGPTDMKKQAGMLQPIHEEQVEVSANPPETDPNVTFAVGAEGPPEGNGVYYDGPFDIDGISLYFYGGGFYFVAPGNPHSLLFHHRCPPSQIEHYQNHWRSGWGGFHDRWAKSHKPPPKHDPKHVTHHDTPGNKVHPPPLKTNTPSKAYTPPSKTKTVSKAYTPPSKTNTPSKVNTPPPKTNTAPKVNPPPQKTYTPPPKHWNSQTKRWE